MAFGVEKVTLAMPMQCSGQEYNVPLDYFVPKEGFGEQKPVMVLPGMGEEGLTCSRITRQLHTLGLPAVVGVLRFPDKDCLDSVVKGGPDFLAAHINERYGHDKDDAVNTISQSQSGGAMLLAAPLTERLGTARHAVISPVGLNSPRLGETMPERKREFLQRLIVENMLKNWQIKPSNWRAGIDISKRYVADTVGSWMRAGYNLIDHKFEYAFGEEMHKKAIEGLRTLVITESVKLILTAEDPVFPPHEILETVGAYMPLELLKYLVLGGPHEAMSSELGQIRLRSAFAWLQQQKALHN